MANKERQSRDKQENLVKLANSAEKARQDAIASLQEQTEALRQNHRVINHITYSTFKVNFLCQKSTEFF